MEFSNDLIIILLVVAMLAAMGFFYSVQRANRKKRMSNKPPRMDAVNDTNYNLERIDTNKIDNLNKQEAKTVRNKMDKNDIIPGRNEFFDLKDDIDSTK